MEGGDARFELLVAQRALAQAAAHETDPRLRAAANALCGSDRGLAGALDPGLIACQSYDGVTAYFAERAAPPQSHDYVAAAVVLTWSMESPGAYDALRAAHDRALSEKRFHFAVGSRERLAHHALLFGDVEVAKSAIEDAMQLAVVHRLPQWYAACAAAAARLALDLGNLEQATQFLERGRSLSRAPETLALFAPAGVALALESGDGAALAEWTSPELLDVALRSDSSEAAIAATIAALAAGNAIALRRALLLADGATGAVELFSRAARYGELSEARFGADALVAVFGGERRYLKAHALLARAHVLLRFGERSDGIDNAADAARAFNALGLRRWMNEAMLLLVRPESAAASRQRRRRAAGAGLTSREQQVVTLIRRGARNREVAAALQISEHTVERHVSSILGRLGLRSRWQIGDSRKADEH